MAMSAVQKRLTLILALLVALQAALNVVQYFGEVSGGRFGGDFISFWRAAQHLAAGTSEAIYDAEAWRQIAEQGAGQLEWFVYPPFALFGLWPLRGLSYDQAVFWWSVLPLPIYFLLVGLLVRRSLAALDPSQPPSRREHLQLSMLAGVLCLPFLTANLFSGQTGAWLAVAVLGAVHFWPHRAVLAGVCIGLIAVKPQMGLLLPFALAAEGRWRSFSAAAATVAALVLLSSVWLGVGVWSDYVAMTQLFSSVIAGGYAGIHQLELGPYVSLVGIGAPAGLAIAVQIACSLAALAAITRVFRGRGRADDRQDLRFAMLALGMLVATPYSLSYDTPVLALVIVPIVVRAWRRGWQPLHLCAIVALVAAPFATLTLIDWHVPFGFGSLVLAGWSVWRLYRGVERRPLQQADTRPALGAAA
jgi:hypothetical protein